MKSVGAAGDGSGSSVEHGVYMEEQRYELGTQSEVPLGPLLFS